LFQLDLHCALVPTVEKTHPVQVETVQNHAEGIRDGTCKEDSLSVEVS
jgi:hypothetical protein